MAKVIHFISSWYETIVYTLLITVFIGLLLSIGGCATKPEVRTEYVQVTPKEPPIIPRPELDTDYLKPGMDAGTVIQMHRLTITKLQGWGLQLESALDAYRAQPKGQ